ADTGAMTTRGMKAIAGNHTGYQDVQAMVTAASLAPPVQEALYYAYPFEMSSPHVDRQGGADKKKPLPHTRKGRRVLQHRLSVITDNRLGLPRSFELWHRAPSASSVAATLSKPLSRECLFNPLSERLSTLPGSGVYVAREPHLPRNESLSCCITRSWSTTGNAAGRSILHSSSCATRNVGRKFHDTSSAHTLIWCSCARSVHLRRACCLHGGRSDKSYSQNHCQIQSLVRLVGRKINTLRGLCTIIAETGVQSSVRAVVILYNHC